jgi:hypothetical protein
MPQKIREMNPRQNTEALSNTSGKHTQICGTLLVFMGIKRYFMEIK